MMVTALLVVSGVVLVAAAGCLRVSNNTWYVRSAPVPEGWPELTPIGTVEVKEYPLYRAASVSDVDVRGGGGAAPMFFALFDHIKREDIAMTAPVDMRYDDERDEPRMTSMAFLYREPDMGQIGVDGAVRVEDLEPSTFASVGVRGDYNTRNYRKGLEQLRAWLEAGAPWVATGPARYLGYNDPFVPAFFRYGEVQVPVAPAMTTGRE